MSKALKRGLWGITIIMLMVMIWLMSMEEWNAPELEMSTVTLVLK